MQVSDLQRMFDYDHWANCEILKAMKATATVPEKTVGRMAHVLSAGKLWLERILGEKQSMAVWPGSTIADCERLADEMAGAWRNYLAQFARDQATLDQIIHYKNTKGELWSSRVEDVLIHVIMHSM